MAEWTIWRRYTRDVIEKLPNRRGEYQIAARNKITVDTGSSDSDRSGIRGRLIERLIHNKCPTGYFFRCRYAGFLDSPTRMEGKTTRKLIAKNDKRPKYNKRTPHVSNYPFL